MFIQARTLDEPRPEVSSIFYASFCRLTTGLSTSRAPAECEVPGMSGELPNVYVASLHMDVVLDYGDGPSIGAALRLPFCAAVYSGSSSSSSTCFAPSFCASVIWE